MAQAPKPTPDEITEAPKTVSVTMEELQALIGTASAQAARQAVAEFQATQPAHTGPAPQRRLRNSDFEAQGHDPGRQSQEDVATLSAQVGPVTHKRGFIPHVPEVIAKRDLDTHASLIGKIEGMGYVVVLNKVEFSARWEPTEAKLVGSQVVRCRVFGPDGGDPPEPTAAAPLIEALRNLDPQNSRIWLTGWLRGKAPSGDRQIDELAQQENRQSELVTIRNAELSTVEGGSFGHLDNLGEAGAGMEHQKLAPLEA